MTCPLSGVTRLHRGTVIYMTRLHTVVADSETVNDSVVWAVGDLPGWQQSRAHRRRTHNLVVQ